MDHHDEVRDKAGQELDSPSSLLPLAPSSPGPVHASLTVDFPASGPLGITFGYNQIYSKLQISSFADLPGGERGPAAGAKVLHPGLLLTSINGEDFLNRDFSEAAEFLRGFSNDSDEPRSLTFSNPLNAELPMAGPPVVAALRSRSSSSSSKAKAKAFSLAEEEVLDGEDEEEKKSTSPPSSRPVTGGSSSKNSNSNNDKQVSPKPKSQVAAPSASTSMLEIIKVNKEARKKKERRESVILEAEMAAKIYHPYHVKLKEALQQSELLGPPFHVSVKNESYWHEQRRLLGGRYHSVRSVQKEHLGTQYQAMIYELKRQSDFSLGPGKKYIGLFSTSAKAYRACEKACEEVSCHGGAQLLLHK